MEAPVRIAGIIRFLDLNDIATYLYEFAEATDKIKDLYEKELEKKNEQIEELEEKLKEIGCREC